MKSHKCGSADSKYFGNLNQFERDIEEKIREHEETKAKVREIILADPSKMDLRYRDVLNAVKEIRDEFGL